MTWTTPQLIAKHTGRHVDSVRRALRVAGISQAREPGLKGARIPLSRANRFIRKQWPECPPLPDTDQEGQS